MIPIEEKWPYTDKVPAFDTDPPNYVYGLAHNYGALYYFCHDPLQSSKEPVTVLENVKKFIAAGIPSAFGFYLYPSFNNSDIKENTY